jgi:hypothetical protein
MQKENPRNKSPKMLRQQPIILQLFWCLNGITNMKQNDMLVGLNGVESVYHQKQNWLLVFPAMCSWGKADVA